jgi:TRAP-type uncharacterized transport system substrate-binding protein
MRAQLVAVTWGSTHRSHAGLATTKRMLFAPKGVGAESQASSRPEKTAKMATGAVSGTYQSVTIVITGVFAGSVNGYHGWGS